MGWDGMESCDLLSSPPPLPPPPHTHTLLTPLPSPTATTKSTSRPSTGAPPSAGRLTARFAEERDSAATTGLTRRQSAFATTGGLEPGARTSMADPDRPSPGYLSSSSSSASSSLAGSTSCTGRSRRTRTTRRTTSGCRQARWGTRTLFECPGRGMRAGRDERGGRRDNGREMGKERA